ncbi:DUF2254 domain-containing protein [uncultured Pontibacter sp.]|uniref:DUF2254 domain-containing protein n=1 Tax=uncultured Pontibacter sp. TaxID=453356 RepID=UPI00261BEDC6|nr:DUF2254 domain-containing protein [uncultured Pontibacter sp.]
MNKIYSKAKFIYYYIVNSIGFYPTLISMTFALLALVMLYLEVLGISKVLKDDLPFVIISNSETARLILSSITTGIISLTVFSFTMVMLVLNQAGSNFTPRVIPGLISYKSNQRVMGLYLGTLIYTLIIMVNVHSSYYSVPLPGFSIFLAMCFTIVCLGFFVYFIHSISLSIQIESILESIFEVTRKKLKAEIEEAKEKGGKSSAVEGGVWIDLKSPKTGYLQSMEEEEVVKLCRKHDVVLCFEQPLGSFFVEDIPFAQVNKPIEAIDDFTEQLFVHLNFYREERPDVNYLFGFKHITESAVRALSPSLNDPGTCIKAIDYLTALFILRMQLPDEKVLYDESGEGRVLFKHETFENVLTLSLSPIRLYGKGTNVVIIRLLFLFRSMLVKVSEHPHLKPCLYNEALLLVNDVDGEVNNAGDREKINEQLQVLNSMQVLPRPLPLLSVNIPGQI